jgi:hypothetical protein
MKPPRFIVLDGMDGAGKSSQVGPLAEWLAARGRAVTTCRDPGSTAVGDAIRAILLDRHDLHLGGSTTPGSDPITFTATDSHDAITSTTVTAVIAAVNTAPVVTLTTALAVVVVVVVVVMAACGYVGVVNMWAS